MLINSSLNRLTALLLGSDYGEASMYISMTHVKFATADAHGTGLTGEPQTCLGYDCSIVDPLVEPASSIA